MFVYAFYIVIINLLFFGLSLSKGQPLISDLSKLTMLSRTGISLYLLPFSCICFNHIINFKWKIKSFLNYTLLAFSFFVILFSFIVSMNIGNRAFIIAFLISLIFISFFKILKLKNKIVKNILLIILWIAILSGFCLIFGLVPSFLADIPIFKRFLEGGSNSTRLNLYKVFFAHFILKPFGGIFNYLDDYYVHNFLLDIYNFTGIFPFSIFTYLFIKSILSYYKIKKYTSFPPKNVHFCYIGFVACISIGLFEPLFQANPFTIFFFITFFVTSIYVKSQNRFNYKVIKI